MRKESRTRNRLRLQVALVALVCVAGVAQAEEVEVLEGDVLAGVDPLGRILVAIDQSPADGQVDRYFLFTDKERIPANIASVERGQGQLKVRNQSQALEVRIPSAQTLFSLAVNARQPFRSSSEILTVALHQGVELVQLSGTTGSIENLDIADLSLWPAPFEVDYHGSEGHASGDTFPPLLGPCPPDGDCEAGGQGSSECSISGCKPEGGTGPDGCSVSCDECMYACCKCIQRNWLLGGNFANCRCRLCVHEP